MADLTARVDKLEGIMTTYRQECQDSSTEVTKKVDRMILAALGDPQMGVKGFVEVHREQHADLLEKVSGLAAAQTESRAHRQQHAHIPAVVDTVKTALEAHLQDEHDRQIEIATYKKTIKGLWVAVGVLNVLWPVGVIVWRLLT
jgi:hypothetical protein